MKFLIRFVLLMGIGTCWAFLGCSQGNSGPPQDQGIPVSSGELTFAGERSVHHHNSPEGEKGGTKRLLPNGSAATQPAGKRYAVLVGINEYNLMAPLRYCVRDMEELKHALVNWGGYEEKNVTLLVDTAAERAKHPTPGAIDYALSKICKEAKEEDSVLFAFSGHGERDADGYTYLVPSDGSGEALHFCLRLSRVHELMGPAQCKARQRLIILDCCHAAGKRSGSGPLKELQPGQGLVELLSCRENEVSREDDDLRHGLFSYFMIQAIRTGAADREIGNGDGDVSVNEASEYVDREIQRYVASNSRFRGHRQSPMIRQETGGRPLILSRAGNKAEVPLPNLTDTSPAADLELVTLPGLTGRWWFEETPWFLPELRQKVTKLPEVRVAAYAPADAQVPPPAEGAQSRRVREFLNRLRAACEQHLRNVEGSEPQRAKELRNLIRDLDREFLDDVAKRGLVETARGLKDPHLLAVVQHRLGQQDASASYEEAIARYESQINQLGERSSLVVRGLYAVCLADFGMLQFAKDEFAQAEKHFRYARDQARHLGSHAVPFEIFCLTQEVLAGRKLGTKWDKLQHAMTEAFQLAEGHLDPAHPLRAYLHERRAWLLMDQWQVSEARREFQRAIQLREKSLAENHLAESASPPHVILHDEHGLAMCDLFSGEVDKARASYQALQNKIIDMLNQGDGETADLAERLVNTTERLGDTYLMSHRPCGKEAAAWYQDAHAYAQQLGPTTVTSGDPDTVRARLLLKTALAASVAGNQEQCSRALRRYREMPLHEAQAASLDAYQRAASAIVELNSSPAEKIAEARESLRQLLRAALPEQNTETNAKARKGLGRETFELLLLVGPTSRLPRRGNKRETCRRNRAGGREARVQHPAQGPARRRCAALLETLLRCGDRARACPARRRRSGDAAPPHPNRDDDPSVHVEFEKASLGVLLLWCRTTRWCCDPL